LIVIGIDPGTLHLGWGAVRAEGTRIVHVDHGVIHTKPKESLAERLCEIDDCLEQVLRSVCAEHGAVESLFFAKDAQSAMKLGHARGVVLLRLARANVEVFEYPPARVKQAVVGTGRADKQQVALMVKALLGLRAAPAQDAADALAVAITHAHVARFDRVLLASKPGSR
jgi:crossover junction endodeoxyribonuclease RuvC